MEHLSLREFCWGIPRWGSFAGDPVGYVEESLRDGNISPWGPVGELGRMLVCRGLM
jgi:hypothetical protein